MIIAFLRSLHLKSFKNNKNPWRLIIWVFFMWFLHVISMMHFEKMSFGDANWLTWTTMLTVGYGDLSAKTDFGRICTMLFMYAGGIFVLATGVSILSERKAEGAALKLSGKWRWKLENHILIISPYGHETEDYYSKLISEIRMTNGHEETPIQILSPCFDTCPDGLRKSGVVYYNGIGTQSDLEACDYHKAKVVVVLGDNRDLTSDARVFDIVSRIDPKSFVVAECVDDRSRERFRNVGADCVVRPARGYPEMIARALTAPGTERVMEELFSASGKTIHKIDLGMTHEINIAASSGNLQRQNIGILVALQDGTEMSIAPTGPIEYGRVVYVLGDSNMNFSKAKNAIEII